MTRRLQFCPGLATTLPCGEDRREQRSKTDSTQAPFPASFRAQSLHKRHFASNQINCQDLNELRVILTTFFV